jgi:hypothetical protein
VLLDLILRLEIIWNLKVDLNLNSNWFAIEEKDWKLRKVLFYFLNRLWAVFPRISGLGPASLLFTFTAHGPAHGPPAAITHTRPKIRLTRPSNITRPGQRAHRATVPVPLLHHARLAGPIPTCVCSCWTWTPTSAALGVHPHTVSFFFTAGANLGGILFPVQPSRGRRWSKNPNESRILTGIQSFYEIEFVLRTR